MDTHNPEFAEQAAITASVVPDELRIGFSGRSTLAPSHNG